MMTKETSEVMVLLRLFEQSDFTALRIETAGISLSVAKDGGDLSGLMAPAQAPAPVAAVPEPAAAAPVPAPTGEAPAPAPAAAPSLPDDGDTVMRSPMLGTFYRAPSPEEPPYVNVGDTVTKGQILCLIECMKLFNTIEAETDGVVTGVEVENGAMVEFDQPLIRIRAN
ncbi:MAG: acetyl-CoA carboxylase, biotin carboxyl carrier protein [Rhodobacteraceae bacterium HLUCCA12]|nr:MAG: acetyl-CoA carboxylase, biotin carboxyl carrier protein [Rhodobacteraceae bacterium HLUCCA12]